MDDEKYLWGEVIDDKLKNINVRTLTPICKTLPMTRTSGLSRKELYKLIALQDEPSQRRVYQEFQHILENPNKDTCKVSWILKRKQEEEENYIRNVKAKLEGINHGLSETGDETETLHRRVDRLLRSDFMRAPPQDSMEKIVKEFTKHTGNDATRTIVCACCALEIEASETWNTTLEAIPNKGLLLPTSPHPKHEIIEDMLLEPSGVDSEASRANICHDCYNSLEQNQLPPLSLANNMWIGPVPDCLKMLTLAERLLIAKYLPTAYVVKLYPKQAGAAHWDPSQLYSGLKGSVSTYELDPKLVASMVDGKVLPSLPTVLSAAVAVTFITPGGKTQFPLPKILYVRRQIVREALQWLIANNPLYADVIISEERLQLLPENDVPLEIRSTARHSTDMESVIREHEGYVPSDEDDETSGIPSESLPGQVTDEPSIIPLHLHGVVDVDGVGISEKELMGHAFINSIVKDGKIDGEVDVTERYAYRRGGRFVNEYARTLPSGTVYEGDPENPNHLLGCFPTLFPYGTGGFETNRPIKVIYEKHIKWALSYHDRRFRLHEQFAFQVFGVFQKRQVCRSVSLQIHKAAFKQHEKIIKKLTPEDFTQASQEEIEGKPFSHEGVRVLRQHLRAVRSKVIGTDENRLSMRSKAWSTTAIYGPPSLWVTLNPSDQDPIAQVIAGADINLDEFDAAAGPTVEQRSQNVANDPYASAKSFHFIIDTILNIVFGIKRTSVGIERRPGVFGTVRAYIGTVEAQGRGTLHLHMLLWLKDAPPPSVMRAALQDERFRQRVTEFIKATIHADIDGKNTDAVIKIPKRKEVSYSRPINPSLSKEETWNEENALARTLQFHRCNTSTCLQQVNGRMVCKRKAPFALSQQEWVNAEGEWGPKRTCANLNNWNPWIMLCLRANHDAKLIVNGAETCVLLLYITNYAFKKQSRSSNTSALLAHRLAFHKSKETTDDYSDDELQQYNKRLLQRCANALLTQREFSGPEINSYLMGWGDRFESHHYVPFYMDRALSALKRAFPTLTQQKIYSVDSTLSTTEDDQEAIISVTEGHVELKDQLLDYQHRGEALAPLNLFNFMINTYEDDSEIEGSEMEVDVPMQAKRGRPKSTRIPYLAGREKSHKSRVERVRKHETILRFIGQWFPRNNCPTGNNELHTACMLLFLKAWRQLTDLKEKNEAFVQSLARFLDTATMEEKDFMENIQYYHDCWDVAQKRRDAYREGKTYRIFDYQRETEEAPFEEDGTETHNEPTQDRNTTHFDEDAIERARLKQRDTRDRVFAEEAMLLAFSANVFGDNFYNSTHSQRVLQRRANNEDMDIITNWAVLLKDITRKQITEDGLENVKKLHIYTHDTQPSIQLDNGLLKSTAQGFNVSEKADRDGERAILARLNDDQRKAHNIIERRLFGEDQGQGQLLMVVIGEGGTGKSVLIDAITETFGYYGQTSALAKCAPCAIAATHIGGCTIHMWAGLGINRPKSICNCSKRIEVRRKKNILGKTCLIIDEMSMLHTTLFTDVTKVVAYVKKTANEGDEHLPFAGMHVILMGDFHQFPPVARASSSLYSLSATKEPDALQGQRLYKEFTTVVRLHQQLRIRDHRWMEILSRLRVGQCTDDDVAITRSLILNRPECPSTDFDSHPWSEAILITTRHTVREAWNAARLKQHCRRTGNIRYIVSSEDYMNGTGEELSSCTRHSIASMKDRDTGKLSDRIEIAIGMKAMILFNLSTEADIANGTLGTIRDIVLDPREETRQVDNNDVCTVHLKYPPAMILFEPDGGCQVSSAFTDKRNHRPIVVPEGQIPITPSTVNFTVSLRDGTKLSIRRMQYALTGGYALTDIKAQGQTMGPVIIDLRDTLQEKFPRSQHTLPYPAVVVEIPYDY